jgi:predicted phosphodiesterase
VNSIQKVAVLFDIHGNYLALNAVLEDAKKFDPDCYVFGGDIVSGAAQPKQCMEEFKRIRAIGTLGNTDEKVVKESCELTAWTKNQLMDSDVQILGSLPLCQRIHPPKGNASKDDLLIVHSTPRSCNDFLVLDPLRPGPRRSGQVTENETLREMLDGEDFNTMLFGHIHYTSKREFEGRTLMSVVPVGLPEDNDVRAGYALAEWNGSSWSVTVRRVEYDYERAALFVENSGQPYGERFAAMIRQATYIPKLEVWGYKN